MYTHTIIVLEYVRVPEHIQQRLYNNSLTLTSTRTASSLPAIRTHTNSHTTDCDDVAVAEKQAPCFEYSNNYGLLSVVPFLVT